MPNAIDAHLQAVGSAELRDFGYRKFASETAMNAVTGEAGQWATVTANGCNYFYNAAEGRWVKVFDPNSNTWKQAVEASTAGLGNVTLATAPATFDGVTPANGDRILIADQTDPIENGIYIFNGAGVAMTRAEDLDDGSEADGAMTYVMQGTANGDTQFGQTADDVTIGTDAQAWSLVGPAAGAAPASDTVAGVVELATDAEAIAGGLTTHALTPANESAIHADRTGSALFGDGAAQSFTIAHGVTGMGAGERLITQVTDAATGFDVDVDLTNDTTDITITTLSTPALNAYRVTWVYAG